MNESEDIKTLDFLRFTVRQHARSLASTVKKKNKQHKTLEEWRVNQITGFLRILRETSSDIATAYRKNRVATVAWLTRNLLELSIWIEYCTLSEKNARDFANDVIKDLYGLAGSMEQQDILKYRKSRDLLVQDIDRIFDSAEAKEEIDSFTRDFDMKVASACDSEAFLTDEQISAMAAIIGEEKQRLDKYLKVSEVAQSIGRTVFTKQNKFLSKFAHPTALLICVPLGCDDLNPMSFFIQDAGFLAGDCMILLSAFIAETFPKDATT
jgi:hypothetical protein